MACDPVAPWLLPLSWVEAVAQRIGWSDCGAFFHGMPFLFLFAPVVFLAFELVRGHRPRLIVLVWASLTFYAMFDVRFVPLLIGSSVLDYVIGRRLPHSAHPKRLVALSVIGNLGVLGFFKYFHFAQGNVVGLADMLGLQISSVEANIILPVGVSFYTFQTMSYTIDVYRHHVHPTRDFLEYFAYVSMFPQLVAGPIVRFREVQEQLQTIGEKVPRPLWTEGARRFTLGMAKKVLIADTIAAGMGRFHPGIDALWADPASLSAVEAWLAVLGYTMQLYFDFSGYSDMAIGIGLMIGLRFPENFNAPYRARDPSDFWRRWHMTLSRFLRDYLYIPLGGNRHGRGRAMLNMMIVMALGGLWHGAAWTFVVWGVYHGALLIVYRLVAPQWDRLSDLAARPLMFLLAAVGWVFFRAASIQDAGTMFQALAGPLTVPDAGAMLLLAVTFFGLAWAMHGSDRWWHWHRTPLRDALLGAALAASLIGIQMTEVPFLYYQF